MCFVNAKNTFMYAGSSVKQLAADKERGSEMSFVEVVVLLCLLASEFEKRLNTERTFKETRDIIREFFEIIMAASQVKVEEVPPTG